MRYEVVVSVDQAGILEYWTTAKNDYKFPTKIVLFESKLDTGINYALYFYQYDHQTRHEISSRS